MRSIFKLKPLIKYKSLSSYQDIIKRQLATFTGLPFKITRVKANEIFSNNRRFLEESSDGHSTALSIYKSDPVKECYIPFHSADVKGVTSAYVGEYGIDRTEYYWTTVYDGKESRQVLESRTVTDWYRCSGDLQLKDYPFGTLSTQIYAGFVYPRRIIEPILQTHDVINIAPINSEMLKFEGKQKIVYPHEMKMAFALEKLNSRIYNKERSRAHAAIIRRHRADHSRVTSLDVNLADAEINLISYHIPSYVYESKVTGLLNYKIINAYSGGMHGNKIYSIVKSALFGASIGGALTAGITMVTNPILIVPQILLRIVIGSSVSGAISGSFANMYNQHQNYKFISTCENETKENTQHIESDDDKERRKLAADLNIGTDYVVKNKLRLPIDKCKLLGLNPEDEITLENVKSAYHQKIKKWHPDFFREKNSQKIAEAMSRQLNDARDELIEILQTSQPK